MLIISELDNTIPYSTIISKSRLPQLLSVPYICLWPRGIIHSALPTSCSSIFPCFLKTLTEAVSSFCHGRCSPILTLFTAQYSSCASILRESCVSSRGKTDMKRSCPDCCQGSRALRVKRQAQLPHSPPGVTCQVCQGAPSLLIEKASFRPSAFWKTEGRKKTLAAGSRLAWKWRGRKGISDSSVGRDIWWCCIIWP